MALPTALTVFFGLCSTVAFSQATADANLFSQSDAASSVAHDFYYEIPFEYPGAIILKACVGGESYDFAFDTGGYTMFTDALEQKNNFPVIKSEMLGSANGIKKEANIVLADSLSIGSLVFNNVAAYQVNFDNSPTAQCMIDGGLIGSGIIEKYIWQIDYPNRKIIVTDNINKIQGLEEATKINVFLNSHLQPYFMAQVNGHFQWFMFDTGCSSLLYMDPKDAAKYTAEAKATAKILGGTVETHHGRIKDTINVFKADFEIDNLKLTDKPVHYREGSGLTLFGSPVIKNYIIILNFKEKEMYFLPIKNALPANGWERFGFSLEYEGGKYKIATIIAGTQPDKQGIKVGDEVTAINGTAIHCNNYCDCRDAFTTLLDTASQIKLRVKGAGKAKVKDFIFKKEKIF